eukprot:TRINITY_DN19521_c0_g1_i1.p1 TRINITY_DN19521_c0_g1~~TRINITY_DN19521_c0_g1_i1.p1  ORF type:complete len:297 (+),score=55.54 TRINITY_DN19521_c0_g1_i1:112-891(+)
MADDDGTPEGRAAPWAPARQKRSRRHALGGIDINSRSPVAARADAAEELFPSGSLCPPPMLPGGELGMPTVPAFPNMDDAALHYAEDDSDSGEVFLDAASHGDGVDVTQRRLELASPRSASDMDMGGDRSCPPTAAARASRGSYSSRRSRPPVTPRSNRHRAGGAGSRKRSADCFDFGDMGRALPAVVPHPKRQNCGDRPVLQPSRPTVGPQQRRQRAQLAVASASRWLAGDAAAAPADLGAAAAAGGPCDGGDSDMLD